MTRDQMSELLKGVVLEEEEEDKDDLADPAVDNSPVRTQQFYNI
jgi:hypothetical protein